MSENLHLFLKYICPSMAGMIVVGSYSIIDTIFIGHAAKELGLAAVSITWPLVMLFGALGDMLGMGASIIISQSKGRNDHFSAQNAFQNMMFLLILTGIILTIGLYVFLEPLLILIGTTPELMPLSLPYAKIAILGGSLTVLQMAFLSVVRNDGRPVLAMWLVAFGLFLNIVLDYLFIFPLGFGTIGAAIATVLSESIVTIAGLIYFSSRYTHLSLKITKISHSQCLNIANKGIPSLGGQLAILSMLFLHNYQSLKYGSVAGLAAYTFISSIESMGSLLMIGLANGVQPLISYFFGAKDYCKQNCFARYGYLTALILGIMMMLVSFAGHNTFPYWFGLENNVAKLAGHGLIISSTAFVLLGVIRVAACYYQSTERILTSSLLIYGDSFFALPLCLFILPAFFGLNGVWLAMPVSRLILFVPLLWIWNKTWKNHHFPAK